MEKGLLSVILLKMRLNPYEVVIADNKMGTYCPSEEGFTSINTIDISGGG